MPIISCFPTKSKNDDRYLQLVGGTMQGAIAMGGNRVTGLGAPVDGTDAVRQQDLEAVSQEVDGILNGTTPAYIPAATEAKIGGVIVGGDLAVEQDGTLSVVKDAAPASGSTKPVQSGGVYTALQGYIPNSQKGAASGVAALGSDGKVPAGQLPEMDYVPTSQVGASGGVAELDSTGKVPTSQLPSYVDDVVEYDSRTAFPGTGEAGKIYVAKDTNLTYRWSGTEYVEISPSLALGETSATAYRGDRGKTAYDHSQITSGNPHGTTAADVGARPDTWMPSAADVGARPATWTPSAADVGAVPTSRTVNGKALTGNISLTADDVGARANTWMPTASEVGARPASWTPTAADVGALPSSTTLAQIPGDASHRTVSDTEKSTWNGKAGKPKYLAITLTSAGWSSNAQTVAASGVLADETKQLIQPMPAIASQDAYISAGIICSGQAANQLTFKCTTVPTENISLYVVLTDVTA